jgi:uncharacterized protein YegP (UPF0339 family)
MGAKFELKQASAGHYYFNLKAADDALMLTSAMYGERRSAEQGIESVRTVADDARRYDRRASFSGMHYFVLTSDNGQHIGRSALFGSAEARNRAVESVRSSAPEASVYEFIAPG